MYTYKEAAALTGLSIEAIRTRRKRGLVQAVEVFIGKQREWRITEAGIKSLGKTPYDQYKTLYDLWITQQKSGYHTGKPIGPRGIEANEYGLEKFWQYLGETPSEKQITYENLRKALSNVPIDYENRKCHYSQRDQMYKAFISFYRLLVREGVRSEKNFKDLKPKRIFPPRKTVITLEDFNRLLDFNRCSGRSEHLKVSTSLVLHLAAYAGLRRAEIINLDLGHVDLKQKIIYVVDGKGHKNRIVGIRKNLEGVIKTWLKIRPKVKATNLLVNEEGHKFTQDMIRVRVGYVGRRAGVDITPHGLRRAFATIHTDKGLPLPHIQKLLGHSDIKTTMGYVMTDERTAVKSLQELT